MSDKEIARRLRAQAVAEEAQAAEDKAMADELDPPVVVQPPEPAPAPQPAPNPNLPPPAPQPAPIPPVIDPNQPPSPSPVPAPQPAPVPVPTPAPSPTPTAGMSPRRTWIEQTMGVHYGYRGVPESTLSALPQSYPAGSSGEMTRAEGGTGERDEIGLVPGFSVLSIISDDPRAIGHALANAKTSLTEFAVHIQDAKSKGPIKFSEHAQTTLQQAVGSDIVFTDDATDVQLDLQHVPHPLFVPFLTAIYNKDRATAEWLLTEMKYWAGTCFLKQPAQARKFGDFLVNPQASINSGRGSAWVLTWISQTLAAIQLFQRTFNVVDEYEAEYVRAIEQNAAYYRGKFIDGTWDESYATPYYDSPKGMFQNALGVCEIVAGYGGFTDGLARIGAFQTAFLSSAWGFLRGLVEAGTIVVSDKAKADIVTVTDWMYALAVAMADDGSTPEKFDIRRLGRYTVAIGFANPDGSVRKFADHAVMAANNEQDLPRLPPFAEDKALRQHDLNALLSKAGNFGDGYVVDWVPVLAMAVRDGYPGAADAWARLESLDDWKATRQTTPVKYAILPAGKYLDDPVDAQHPAPPPPEPGQTPSTNPPVNTKLTDENGPFSLSEAALVRYGVDTRWTEKQLAAGSYTANNALFGDPAVGTVKAAYMGGIVNVAPSPNPPPAPQPGPSPSPSPAPAPTPSPSGNMAGIDGVGDALFSALPVNQWVKGNSSDTIRKAITRLAPDYIEHGNTGLTSITDAWSGACLDPATGKMYGQGGGHYDSNFNGVYSVDVETGECGLPVKPTILSNAQADEIRNSWAAHGGWVSWGQGVWPSNTFYDGKPGAIHTYGSIWFVDGKMVMPGRIYDLAAGTVELFASAAGSPSNMGLRIGNRLVSVNNMVDQYWDIVQIDYTTKTEVISNFSVPYKPGIGAPYSFNGETYCCAIGSMLYFVKMDSPSTDFPAPLAWSIDATAVQQNYEAVIQTPINPWSAADMAGCQMNTMALDTDANVLYIPAKDWSYMLTWNPLTSTCGKVAIPGAVPPKAVNSAYGRFQYYAKRKCFVLVNSIDEPVYYLKLDAAVTVPSPAPTPTPTSPAPTPPSPAVPPTAPPTGPTFDATTEVLKDTDDGHPSVHGSMFTQPYPTDYVHTLAHPQGGARLPAKVIKTLPLGTGWREIPNTSLESHMTPEQGSGGLYAVTADWMGGAWIEELQMFVQPPGGGHLGNDNSTFYGIDMDAQEAFEFYPPSPLLNLGGGGDHYPGPEYISASHGYGTPTAFLDKRDGRWKVFTMVAFQPFVFDPIARTLEKVCPYTVHNEVFEEQWTGGHACYDAKREIILYHTTARSNQLSHFEPDRNRWFDHGYRKAWGGYGGSTWEFGYYSHMRVDPVRDRLVSLGFYDGLFTLDLSRLTEKPIDVQRIKTAAEFPEITDGAMSFDWDANRQDWVVYATTGMFSMNPDTYALTKIGEGGPVPEHNGCWGRFWYNAKRDEFQTFPTIKSNVWTFKR